MYKSVFSRLPSSLILTTLVICLIATAEGGPTRRRSQSNQASLPSRSLLDLRGSDNTIPSSPPWFYPNAFQAWPDCVSSQLGSCLWDTSQLENCSATKCVLLFFGGCTTTATLVNQDCFCTGLSYPTCAGSCITSIERPELLNYMNSTCSSVMGWSGLPGNWTDLLSVQISDLKPWPWIIRNNNSITNEMSQCPTPETNLGVFAATNVAMLLLTPILGRRTVVQRLTFGLLGKAHSQTWLYMGPFMAGLQLVANTINAVLIKSTPGYSDVSVRNLLLLWCTRPRLAWLVIVLAPFQASEVMYLSCAATTLTAEAILQLLSAYTFGTVANFAQGQHFYNLDHRLDNVPYGVEAKLMYAGSLLWLVVILFTLLAIIWSVLGVNKQIALLATFVGITKRPVKRLQRKLEPLLRRTQESHDTLLQYNNILDQHDVDHLQNLRQARFLQVKSCDSVKQSLTDLIRSIEIEGEDYNKAKSNLKRLERRVDQRQGQVDVAGARREVERLWGFLHITSKNNMDLASNSLNDIGSRVRQAQSVIRHNSKIINRDATAGNKGYREMIKRQQRVFQEWKAVENSWILLQKTWEEAASRWRKRFDRFSNAKNPQGKLRDIVTSTLLGMVGCWVAQWIFWIGFVGLYSNQGHVHWLRAMRRAFY
jgi:hypothetical protein